MARKQKMKKEVDYEKGIVSLTVISNGKQVVADTNKLSPEIQKKLIPLAISHRLGDAAAGKDGDEAFEAVNKVWKGLLEGHWTVRAPAAPAITKKSISEKMDALPDAQKAQALKILEQLGITL